MSCRLYACMAVVGLLLETPQICSSADVVTAEDETLMAFVQLGRFTDRGIVGRLINEANAPNIEAGRNTAKEQPVPHDVLQFLQMRDHNLSKEAELPWWITAEDHSTKATLARFQKYGVIECNRSRPVDVDQCRGSFVKVCGDGIDEEL